jgi:hypothetical protein
MRVIGMEVPVPVESWMSSAGPNGKSTKIQAQLAAVHTKFVSQFPDMLTDGSWNEPGGIRVRLTGIGFYDRDHFQTGRAKNHIELYPLLNIDFNPAPIITPPIQQPLA